MVRRATVVRQFVGQLHLRVGECRLLQTLLQLDCLVSILLHIVVYSVFLETRGSKALLLRLVGKYASIILEGVRDV